MRKILNKIYHAAVTLTLIRGLLALGASIPWVFGQWISFIYSNKVGVWLNELPWHKVPLSWVSDAYDVFWEIFGMPAIVVLTVIWLLSKIPIWKINQTVYVIKTLLAKARPNHVSRTYVRILNQHDEVDVDIQRLRTAKVDDVQLEYRPREQTVYATGSKGCTIRLEERFHEIDGLQLAVAQYNH